MGIKHFFMWFKSHFDDYMQPLRKGQTLADVKTSVDNLMIDMNGVFHNSAQRIYEYGNFKPPRRLMGRSYRPKNDSRAQLRVFEDVCKTVEELFCLVRPRRRLILCVDGPAPISKQNQQRQRRFRSAMEASPDAPFDSNCITPGTKFMDRLTKYIDWYIRKRISEDSEWQAVEVIFSNEKVPGEGEHKIINYIRFYGDLNETYCINGLDADLIMLALGTHAPNFYILREDLYDPRNEYFCIDIGATRIRLADLMRWESDKHEFSERSAVDDFIFMCFIVGNDFLPHIPSIEIIERGIELILEVHKEVGPSYGHITTTKSGRVQFVPKALEVFLGTIGHHEKENLEHKMRKRKSFFPDPILKGCSAQSADGSWEVDIKKYQTDYWAASFGKEIVEEEICHEYFEGMQWVLSYYTRGVPHWKWHFAHHYAPPASVLSGHMKSFVFPNYGKTVPSTPFQQLLSVLPPQSAGLIPIPLCHLLTSSKSPLKEHCPREVEIDLAGKRKEWEGIVLLPMVDFELVRESYFEYIAQVTPQELKRNITGSSLIYKYAPKTDVLKSFYGDIHNYSVEITEMEL